MSFSKINVLVGIWNWFVDAEWNWFKSFGSLDHHHQNQKLVLNTQKLILLLYIKILNVLLYLQLATYIFNILCVWYLAEHKSKSCVTLTKSCVTLYNTIGFNHHLSTKGLRYKKKIKNHDFEIFNYDNQLITK